LLLSIDIHQRTTIKTTTYPYLHPSIHPSTMKISSRCLLLLVLSAVANVTGEGDDHEHESCACAAAEEGFTIDCSDQDAMTAALAALSASDCETDCSSEDCHKNFLIIQSHHDYCLEDELPSTLEDALHNYEDNCDECEITKKTDPSLEACPAASCTDDSGDASYTTLTANDCSNDCSSETCASAYRTLKVVHDTCPEDTLSTAAETNFHDMEETCDELHGCNLPAGEGDPLVCNEGDDGDSPAASHFLAPVALFGMVAAMAALDF